MSTTEVLISVIFLLGACNGSEPTAGVIGVPHSYAQEPGLTVERCQVLYSDLTALRDRIDELIRARGLSEVELLALERGELNEQETLGISDDEYKSMRAVLERAYHASGECCSEPVPDPGTRKASCKRGYGACLIGAGVGGFLTGHFAVVYWVFAWNCYCGYCEGGHTDTVCL